MEPAKLFVLSSVLNKVLAMWLIYFIFHYLSCSLRRRGLRIYNKCVVVFIYEVPYNQFHLFLPINRRTITSLSTLIHIVFYADDDDDDSFRAVHCCIN